MIRWLLDKSAMTHCHGMRQVPLISPCQQVPRHITTGACQQMLRHVTTGQQGEHRCIYAPASRMMQTGSSCHQPQSPPLSRLPTKGQSNARAAAATAAAAAAAAASVAGGGEILPDAWVSQQQQHEQVHEGMHACPNAYGHSGAHTTSDTRVCHFPIWLHGVLSCCISWLSL